MLIHLDSGDLVIHEAFEPPYGPAVAANVAPRTGDYRLVATSGERRTAHRLTLSSPGDPSMDGTCVYRGPGGDLDVVEVVPSGDQSVPELKAELRPVGSVTEAADVEDACDGLPKGVWRPRLESRLNDVVVARNETYELISDPWSAG